MANRHWLIWRRWLWQGQSIGKGGSTLHRLNLNHIRRESTFLSSKTIWQWHYLPTNTSISIVPSLAMSSENMHNIMQNRRRIISTIMPLHHNSDQTSESLVASRDRQANISEEWVFVLERVSLQSKFHLLNIGLEKKYTHKRVSCLFVKVQSICFWVPGYMQSAKDCTGLSDLTRELLMDKSCWEKLNFDSCVRWVKHANVLMSSTVDWW
jgi:hypothetical protein